MDKQRAIIIDTREQRPWVFPAYAAVRVGTLKQGDYALEGDDRYAIERKSLEDFIGTIFSGWERFKRNQPHGQAICKRHVAFTKSLRCRKRRSPPNTSITTSSRAVMSRIAELGFMGVNADAAMRHASDDGYYLLMKRLEVLEAGRGNELQTLE